MSERLGEIPRLEGGARTTERRDTLRTLRDDVGCRAAMRVVIAGARVLHRIRAVELRRQMRHPEALAVTREGNPALDLVFELSDVPRPMKAHQQFQRCGLDARNVLPVA